MGNNEEEEEEGKQPDLHGHGRGQAIYTSDSSP
jgi:hypothetical protein